jgi:HlyD family secretion protein
MKRRSMLVLALSIAALVALSVWAFRPRPVSVETREIVLSDFEQTVNEEGKTRVRDRYLVTAPAAGRVDRIVLKAGDPVRTGDVVAVVRPTLPSLRDVRTLDELRERVGVAEASKLAADAEVGRARAALALAQSEFERTQKLSAQGFTAKATTDDARLKVEQQGQALKAAEFTQHAATHELALARATLAQGDHVARGQTGTARIEIRSPVDGQVLRVIQESEAAVALGAELLEIGDASSLEAVIDVLSQDALRIAPGMPARLSVSSAVPPIRGVVRRVEPSGRTKISTLGVEEQRVSVIVDFTRSEEDAKALGDGYRVDASIVVLARSGVPVAPVGALFRDAQGWAVFVADGATARRRSVELGARNQHSAWVEKGLEPGDRVIVYPPDTVRDGARIELR